MTRVHIIDISSFIYSYNLPNFCCEVDRIVVEDFFFMGSGCYRLPYYSPCKVNTSTKNFQYTFYYAVEHILHAQQKYAHLITG